MRRLLPPALAAGLVACQLLTVPVETSATTTIEGAGLLGQLLGSVELVGLTDFEVAVSDALADQGVDEGDVRSVRLTAFTLAGAPDLGFLDSLSVSVEATGFPRTRVAWADGFADGATEVALTLDDVDLAEAVVAGDLVWTVEATGEAPVDDTTLDAFVAAEVIATPQGACRAAREASAEP